MGGVIEATGDPVATAASVPFPSTAWFECLAEHMAEQHEQFRKLGTIDCTMAVSIVDGGADGEAWNVQVTFDEFTVSAVHEIEPDALEEVDFVLETDLETWQEMVESIEAGDGRPDLDHTLNRLSLPGTPIRVWSSDPLGRDMFFRFNQTLQRYINNCAAFHTTFPGDG